VGWGNNRRRLPPLRCSRWKMTTGESHFPASLAGAAGRLLVQEGRGNGALVSTLKTRYPCIQALSQNKEQGMHPRPAMQAVALDNTSLQRWALEPPRVPQARTSAPCSGELRCCHVAYGLGPHLLDELSSGTATCSSAPDLASLPRWAPALPRVRWLWVVIVTTWP
jgi:hypothetical protein